MENLSKHWLYNEKLKWRILACNLWTGIFSLFSSLIFLFCWMSSPNTHIYILPIPDYFVILLNVRTWLIVLGISLLSVAFARLHFNTYKVQAKLKTTILESLLNIFKPKNVIAATFSGLLGAAFMALTFMITESDYSSTRITCTDGLANAWCLNEKMFIAILYGFLLCFLHSMKGLDDDSCTLKFNCVQPSRLQAIRYASKNILKSNFHKNLKFIRFFIPVYYFVAKHLFLQVSDLLGFFTVEYDPIISVFKPFLAVSVACSLFLSGTFLLFVNSLSWELTNLFLVKNYPFLMQTMFSDKQEKLLVANIDKKQPLLVQHIAFQSLSELVCNSATCRKQLFDVPPDSGAKDDTVHWNIVANECLDRIRNFNEELKMCYYEVTNGNLFREKTKAKSIQMNKAPVNEKPSALTTNLVRRAKNLCPEDKTVIGSPAISRISSVDPTLSRTQIQSVGPIHSPRLWTVQSPMREAQSNHFIEKNVSNTIKKGSKPQKTFEERKQMMMSRVLQRIKSFSIVSFFFSQQPDRHAANLFTNFYLVRWCVRILSVLAAKSVTEDVYGVVQCRLDQVLQELLELLIGLERNCKMPISCTSPAVVSLLRRQHSLKAECVSSIYRISTAFPHQLDTLHLKPELARRLALFSEFKC